MIFLAQTDTTIGLLSKDFICLNKVKQRDLHTKILLEVSSLKALKDYSRIPNAHKNRIRRGKYATFITRKKRSFRVIFDYLHLRFLKKTNSLYSTSANLSKNRFCLLWAQNVSDVWVCDKRGFEEKKASNIYKISQIKQRKIR